MTLDEAIKHAEEVAKDNEQRFRNHYYGIGTKSEYMCQECASEHRQLAEWLKDYKRLKEQEPRWILVSEGLPKAGEYIGDVERYYLVQNEYGDMLVARYTHSGYWEQIYQLKPYADEVVAWMLLPEPYKKEEQE